ncbi:unnamed protein product [Lampetra fluviatilis]
MKKTPTHLQERRAPLKMREMQPAAQLAARPPIAAGDEIRAAHGHLAQLLHAAASILEEINLGAAGGADQPPADVSAIENPE